MTNRLGFRGQFESVTHDQLTSAQGGQFDFKSEGDSRNNHRTKTGNRLLSSKDKIKIHD